MGSFRMKKSFENAFKKHVHNFDETKIWFDYSKRGIVADLTVCFVVDGKLQRFPMWQSQHSIDQWGNHFIDFLNTGKFDYHAYWIIYSNYKAKGEILKFPMSETSYNKFSEHSQEQSKYLQNFRYEYGDCGMKVVPKPLNNETHYDNYK